MNKYQKILNKTTRVSEINHILNIKLKYKDKWLVGGTPINHPVHQAYEKEMYSINYKKIRLEIKKNFKDMKELLKIKSYYKSNNLTLEHLIFKE